MEKTNVEKKEKNTEDEATEMGERDVDKILTQG